MSKYLCLTSHPSTRPLHRHLTHLGLLVWGLRLTVVSGSRETVAWSEPRGAEHEGSRGSGANAAFS